MPFGLPAQVLGDNAEQWQALVFGMTCRIYPDPQRCNPRPLWAALDARGLRSPRMIGWWEGAACPVRVVLADAGGDAQPVRATLFVGTLPTGGKSFAIAIANWAPHSVSFTLGYDWPALAALGLTTSAAAARLQAPSVASFQQEGEWAVGARLTLQSKRSGFNEGWLLWLV